MPVDKSVFTAMFSSPMYRRVLLAGLLITVCILAACWRFAPVEQWSKSQELLILLQEMRTNSFAPLIVISLYVIGGLIVFPVIVLIPFTAFVLGPFSGFF